MSATLGTFAKRMNRSGKDGIFVRHRSSGMVQKAVKALCFADQNTGGDDSSYVIDSEVGRSFGEPQVIIVDGPAIKEKS